jgi:arylformamidase
MKVTFLSHFIDTATPSYGNKDTIQLVSNTAITAGDTANTSGLIFSNNHIGTHVDVPKHFYDNGKTYTDIEPEEWYFESVDIIDIPCTEARLIGINDFQNAKIRHDVDFLIVRTGYEGKRENDAYWSAYPGIASEACEYLRKFYVSLRGIGFDFISLTSPQFKEEGKAAHRVLLEERLGKFIFIVEDMKIAHLNWVPQILLVSPLLVKDGNGGAVTIFGINSF